MPSFPLPDPSTWFTNVLVNAGLIKTNIIDPINTLAADTADSGWATSGGPSPTASTGWSLTSFAWRSVGAIMFLDVTVTRTGGTLTATSTGAVADTAMFTISGSGFVPSQVVWGNFNSNASFGGAFLNSTGATITDMHPTSTISNTDAVKSSWVFPVG